MTKKRKQAVGHDPKRALREFIEQQAPQDLVRHWIADVEDARDASLIVTSLIDGRALLRAARWKAAAKKWRIIAKFARRMVMYSVIQELEDDD